MEKPEVQKSELKVMVADATKARMSISLRGPGGVVILVAWLLAMVLVLVFAPSNALKIGIPVLCLFLVGYLHLARTVE